VGIVALDDSDDHQRGWVSMVSLAGREAEMSCVNQEEPMRNRLRPEGTHHPVCILRYTVAHDAHQSWNCECEVIRAACVWQREADAKALEVPAEELQLHAGEISPRAMRAVRAILAWRATAIRASEEASHP